MDENKFLDEMRNIVKEELEVIVKDEIIMIEEELTKIMDKLEHIDFKLNRFNDRMDITDLRIRMIEVNNKEEFHLLHEDSKKIMEALK